jgi:REP element-mobilizing transposase RayT
VELKFFNPFEEVRKTRHNLPHWQQPGATYFITFRQADSIPAHLLKSWEHRRAAWLATHPQPHSAEQEREYHERFSGQMDRWMDEGHGSCVLRESGLRDLVEESMTHFEGQRYFSFSWIIMPNHVHALVTLHPDWPLEKVLHTWKLRTARSINETLGKQGQFWQHDYFDRLIRDGEHFRNVVRYIRRNPIKAGLSTDEYTLLESDFLREIR